MNKIVFSIIFLLFFGYSFSQTSDSSEPNVSISLTDSILPTIQYFIETKNEILIHKDLIITGNCDTWFSDVVIVTEQFDGHRQIYVPIACGADIQPVLKPDKKVGVFVKLKKSRSSDFFVTVDKNILKMGKYRSKIRFYYSFDNQRLFVESNYVYFAK